MKKQIGGQTALPGFSPVEKDRRPPVGTVLYMVNENLYYDGHPWPECEYLVCKARVRGYYDYKGIPELDLLECIPTVYNYGYAWSCPSMCRLSDIGKRVFATPKEAAEKARKLTEKAEKSFSFVTMRRTWEGLISGADFYLAPLISRNCPEGGGNFELTNDMQK